MTDATYPSGHHRPAHGQHHGLPRANEERLAELGRQLPPPSEEELRFVAAERASRILHRLVAGGVVGLVVLLGALAIAQWLRPMPQPSLQVLTSLRIPGAPPRLAWPGAGEAAVSVQGLGSPGEMGGAGVVPIAGLADVLTAYVVLRDHPLSPGNDGPGIPVTPATIAADHQGAASQEPEVAVGTGETLTERQALEGLLVDSGADMATLLATWDAGSTQAFVARENATAKALGLRATHITDPSGMAPSTTSSAEDLVRLGEAAMAIPALAGIVSSGQATLPETGTVYNLNFDLGQDGIVGIETGSDAAAGGGYLFAARETVGGRAVTVVGAVLGQHGPIGPNTAAVDAGDTLLRSTFAALHATLLARPGQPFARLVTPWGASAPVTASAAISVIGWPGLTARAVPHLRLPSVPTGAGVTVGSLEVGTGTAMAHVTVRTAAQVQSPSPWWRLTR